MQANRDELRELAQAVSQLVVGAYRGMARSFDVTRSELLRLVAAGDPIRPSDLADALDVNPSTVTRCARALEEEGFVRIAGDPADRRSCLIGITPAGRAELARFEEAGVDVLTAVVRDWSAEDVRTFSRLIDRLGGAWMERGPALTRPAPRAASPRWRTTPTGADR